VSGNEVSRGFPQTFDKKSLNHTFFMKLKKTKVSALTITLIKFGLLSGGANAAIIYNEAIDGEISSVSTTPTSLGSLSLGQSDIIGQIGSGARDYFTFTVGSGLILDSITLVSGTGTNHFFGIDDQSTFNDGGGFLIGALFSGAVTESPDFLDTFSGGGAFGGSGVSESNLPAGDYTILLNETVAGSFDYQLRLTSVPEPSSVLILGLGVLGFIGRRRRAY